MRCLYFLLILFSLNINAQEANYTQYTLHDGLVQMQINGIEQDHDGALWLATRGGISKFTGAHFENYEAIDCLPNYAFDIAIDDQRMVWIASSSSLIAFDGINCVSYTYPEWVKGNYKFKLTALPDGSILGSTSFPTMPWYFHEGTFTRFSDSYAIDEDQRIIDIALDTARDWTIVAVDDGLLIYDQDKNLLKRVEILGLDRALLTEGSTNHNILPDQLLRDYTHERYYTLRDDLELQLNCRHDNDAGLCQREENGRPHSYYDSAFDFIFIWDQQLGRSLLIDDIKARFNKVWDIVQIDGYDIILTDKGLVLWSPDRFFSFDEETLPNIWAVSEHTDDTIIFGSFGNGLYRWSDERIDRIPIKKHECYEPQHNKKHHRAAEQIYFHPTSDEAGKNYFATGSGIVSLNDYGAEMYYTHCAPERSVPEASLYAYYDTLSSSLISCQCDGVVWLDADGHILREVDKSKLNNASCILNAIVHDNKTYLGYRPHVAIINGEDISLISYPDSTMVETFICSMVDHRGAIWFGGKHGLYQIFDDQLVPFPFLEGEQISAMLQYSSTKVFFALRSGIMMFDLAAYLREGMYRYRKFNHTNGYDAIEPHQNGLYLDSQERLWISSSTKVSYTYPQSLRYNDSQLNIDITRINGACPGLTESIYHLPRGSNRADISLSLIGLQQPDSYTFSYTYCDKKIQETLTSNQIHLSSLSSGRHDLQITATDATDEIIATKDIQLMVDISISKEPWWTMLLMGMIFSLSMGGLYLRQRNRLIEQEKENLKERNLLREESNQRLTDLNIQLASDNKALQYNLSRRSTEHDLIGDTIKLGPKEDILIQLSQIIYAQTERNRLILHTDTDRIVIYMTLKQLRLQLPDTYFAQINRSTIINIQKITYKGVHEVHMINEVILSLSKSGRAELEQRINNL